MLINISIVLLENNKYEVLQNSNKKMDTHERKSCTTPPRGNSRCLSRKTLPLVFHNFLWISIFFLYLCLLIRRRFIRCTCLYSLHYCCIICTCFVSFNFSFSVDYSMFHILSFKNEGRYIKIILFNSIPPVVLIKSIFIQANFLKALIENMFYYFFIETTVLFNANTSCGSVMAYSWRYIHVNRNWYRFLYNRALPLCHIRTKSNARKKGQNTWS